MKKSYSITSLSIRRLFEDDDESSIPSVIDDAAVLDSDSIIGQMFVELMAAIVNNKLFDYYLGFDREGSVLKLYFSDSTKLEALQQFADSFESTAFEDEKAKIIGSMDVYLLAGKTKKSDALRVLRISLLFPEADAELSDIYPAEVGFEGDVSIEKSSKGNSDEE